MQKIVVIGGGLSGLSTAYLIRQQIQERNLAAEVIVIEKDSRLGGKLWSQQVNGYLCEYGPNGFLTNKPSTLLLCNSLGIYHQLLASNDNTSKRFIYSNAKLHQLPSSQFEFLMSNLISLSGKFRIAREFFIPKREVDGDETLADFTRRRLGDEALQKLIVPMSGGVFAGNPEEMSLQACFPKIYQLEQKYGSLLKAMFKLRKAVIQPKKFGKIIENPLGFSGTLTSFSDGIQVLSDSLANAIGKDNLICDSEVSHIRYNSITRQYQLTINGGGFLAADYLICATPAYVTADLLADLDQKLANNLRQIKYSPLVVVCLGYAACQIEADLNGFGYLLAGEEEIPVLGTLWESSIFAKRAPDGKILFRTMLGGALQPGLCDLDDIRLEQLVKDSLAQILQITVEPELVQIYRHQQAIPLYNSGHQKLVTQIMDSAARYSHLFITGNAYSGVGINDCIAASYVNMNKVISELVSFKQKTC